MRESSLEADFVDSQEKPVECYDCSAISSEMGFSYCDAGCMP